LCKNSTLSPVENISKARESKIKKREKGNVAFADIFPKLIQEIAASSFLNGVNDQGWKISFDWLFKNDLNYLKVLEGNYRNSAQQVKKSSTQQAIDKFFKNEEVIYAEVEQ
jgi:hypothetical protein